MTLRGGSSNLKVPVATPAVVAIVMAAGVVAGGLGSLLGIGGGVFLVPFLNAALGMDFKVAAAISLVTVIATSSAVSAGTAGRGLINLRLGMILEVASAAGGIAAATTMAYVSDVALERGFAVVAALISVLMLSRLERRNVILDAGADPGKLGGRYYDDESAAEVVYRVRRLPAALGISFAAGNVSAAFGIGGGILKVPALNAWCGVPIRAAAATSSLMIGVTAVASVPIQYAHGYVNPPLAAGAVLGVLVGFERWSEARGPGTGQVAQAADGGGAGRGVDRVFPEKRMTSGGESLGRLERHLGRLLIAGVIISAFLLAAGLMLWLRNPLGASTVWLLDAGLLALMATPILRVVVSFAEYLRMRDWFFAAMTMLVLAELTLTVAVAFYSR